MEFERFVKQMHGKLLQTFSLLNKIYYYLSVYFLFYTRSIEAEQGKENGQKNTHSQN